jgi:hypothetical protein
MWSPKQFVFLFFSFIMGSLEFFYYSFLTQHTTEPFVSVPIFISRNLHKEYLTCKEHDPLKIAHPLWYMVRLCV